MLTTRFKIGSLNCWTIEGGIQRLDGGAMFGVVPKPLWEKRIPADPRNRMTHPVSITHSGRRFSADDLALMRQAAQDYAGLGVTEIARTICEWLDWKRPNGRLKNHECRLLLERLRD